MNEPNVPDAPAAPIPPPAARQDRPAPPVVGEKAPLLPPAEPEPEKPPVRIWLRMAVAGAVVIVLLVAFGLIWSQVEGSRIKKERTSLEAQLDESDPNWRLADLERSREEIPEHENSARVIVAVTRLLPRSWPGQQFYERFQDLPPTEQLNAGQTELLEAEMTAHAAALTQARRLADMPRGRHHLKWEFNPIATLLPDLQESRKVANLLQYDAMLRAQQGDADGALRSCRGIINAGRSVGDEPLMISALVRCAIIAVGANAAERTLAQGVAGDAELARLQELLALEDQHPTMRIAVRGERASSYDLLSKMADGRISVAEMDAMIDGQQQAWWKRWSRGNVGRREPVYALKVMTKMVDATKLPEADQVEAEKAYEREIRGLGREATYVRLLVPAVANVGRAIRRKTAYLRCLMVLVAVERYRLAHDGKWPESLAALMPDLLKEIPNDPFDGKPLRYKKLPDGVMVYSVGEDGVDDGGNVDRSKPTTKGADQGYRLWDETKRRQTSSRESLPAPEVELEDGEKP
jgi:hypothetical protein